MPIDKVGNYCIPCEADITSLMYRFTKDSLQGKEPAPVYCPICLEPRAWSGKRPEPLLKPAELSEYRK